MNKINTSICLAACLLASSVQAEPQGPLLHKNKMSIGAGLARNSVGSYHETGFQFFGAYDLDNVQLVDGTHSSVEVGYMDYGFSGNNNDGGIWTTFVLDGSIRDGLGWLARLGLDLGDDSGLMLGAGVAVKLNTATQVRIEYVVRDDIDSLQFNLVYHL